MNEITLSIRQRVLIITLLPLLMITLILGGYFIKTRLDDAQEALLEKGQTMGRMLSSSSEFGLLTQNTDILSNLIRSSINSDEDVVDVVFLDPAFQTLISGKTREPILNKNAGYPLVKNNQVYFLNPVKSTGVDFSDSPDLASELEEPEFIGWVVVILSQKPTQQRQFEILIKGILLATIGLLITLLIALRFGQRITNPILGLTHVVRMLQEGKLETRASTSSTGELRTLAEGINKLAQQVNESKQTLESRVENATTRLRSTLVHLEKQNQALDRAKKHADKANIAKDEFLARMSHELRTPLTSVSGFSRLLDQTELQGEQKEYTRIINLTSGLLLSIIDDILDYSKLESNAIELESIPFNLENAVLDVLEMQTALANDKGLELISVINTETPLALIGDPVRFKQVISNLVSNAVKFTDSGYVAVKVEVLIEKGDCCELRILVEDTGSGIPQNRLNNLFKAFSQADNSISRRYGGSGLGLAIAKRLTELMKGQISIDSEELKGTSVSLTIPFSLKADKATPHKTEFTSVLVYEPHDLVREGLHYQLNRLSVDIHKVDNQSDLFALALQYPEKPIIWGIGPEEISADTINAISDLLGLTQSTLLLSSPKPLPIPSSERLIQLRKPTRAQLLLNSLTQSGYSKTDLQQQGELTISSDIKVLVAEDNDFNRLLISRILENAGCRVSTVTNGQDAVRQALKTGPDIILMDVHMPIMDGIEATKEIRLSQTEIPIIALTANIVSSEHQKLIEAGVNYILLKPINDYELCFTIDQIASGNNPEPIHTGTSSEATALEKYNIDQTELSTEFEKQLAGLISGFKQQNIEKMRSHSHQLIGVSGLYNIPEIEVAGYHLHDALVEEDFKTAWKAIWQLKRLIEGESYEQSEEL